MIIQPKSEDEGSSDAIYGDLTVSLRLPASRTVVLTLGYVFTNAVNSEI